MKRRNYCFTEDERMEIMDIVRGSMNFEGGDPMFYDGSDDDFVCFDGTPNASFLSEARAVYRQFVITISNPTNKPLKFMLTPDYKYSPSYQDLVQALTSANSIINIGAVDTGKPASRVTTPLSISMTSRGYLMDGNCWPTDETIGDSEADIFTAAGRPYSIQDFFAFIKGNPTNLLGMKIADNSSDSMQVDMPLQITPKSPFKTLQSTPLYPSTQLTQDSFQKNVVLFDTENIVLSDQTAIEYTVAPALGVSTPRVVSITFICGAVLNPAKALENKTTKAVKNAMSSQTLLQKVNEGKTI